MVKVQNAIAGKAGWGLTGLSVAFLLMDAGMKVAGAPISMKVTGDLGFAPDQVRVLGILLLAATALYAWPRTVLWGAILITAYLGGAIAVQYQHGAPLVSHVLFGVYVALFVWAGLFLRYDEVRRAFRSGFSA